LSASIGENVMDAKAKGRFIDALLLVRAVIVFERSKSNQPEEGEGSRHSPDAAALGED